MFDEIAGEAAPEDDQTRKPPETEADKRRQRIALAKKMFDAKFFEQFAAKGEHAQQVSQLGLEQHIRDLAVSSPQKVELLVLSMLHSTYEANESVPNLEQIFFRMFVSPITTKKERARADPDDLLAGNIFMGLEGFTMPTDAYYSLLESVALSPKKKHFKKILQYLVLSEEPTKVSPQLIDLVTVVGIDQQYPVLLGSTIKYMLQHGYAVSSKTFKRFVLFLERCKGFEEDAKRFVAITAETSHLEADYALLRPFFMRAMRYKKDADVLKLFEQFRKNLKLNKGKKALPAGEKTELLRAVKREFYDGLIKDLMDRKSYETAQVIYGEKKREKFKVTIDDMMIGLEIFSAQKKIAEYREIVEELTAGETFPPSLFICENIGRTLKQFSSDDLNTPTLDIAESLRSIVRENGLVYSPQLFEDVLTRFVETQQWEDVQTILKDASINNCDPSPKIVSYLKKSLVYCFDTTLRANLQSNIEDFEAHFFSPAQREARR